MMPQPRLGVSGQTFTKASRDFCHRRRMVSMTHNHLFQSTCLQTHPSQGRRGNRHLDQTQFLMSQS